MDKVAFGPAPEGLRERNCRRMWMFAAGFYCESTGGLKALLGRVFNDIVGWANIRTC
jgi:hypothetical protein